MALKTHWLQWQILEQGACLIHKVIPSFKRKYFKMDLVSYHSPDFALLFGSAGCHNPLFIQSYFIQNGKGTLINLKPEVQVWFFVANNSVSSLCILIINKYIIKPPNLKQVAFKSSFGTELFGVWNIFP